MSTTSVDPNSTASASATPSSSQNAGGPTNSPLLFFVALGFGVVFTNLWIIVGVKYCFRYNQRNRQLRAMAENGEPIDLANMHGPRRRRREKKLMTMEEVNERFPLIKYKLWRSKREAEGLPAEGGVTASPSRAASVRSKRSTVELANTSRISKESVRPAVGTSDTQAGAESSTHEHKDKSEPVISEKVADRPVSPAVVDAAEEDEDDPIRTAIAPEMLAAPGDACAICLDTLEDDDDVRGLTCGHAFHASCVDPWLTSRRACCPLCKADYYVPKPRPEGSEDLPAASGRHAFQTTAQPIWVGGRAPFSIRSLPFLSRGTPAFVRSGQEQQPPSMFSGWRVGRNATQSEQTAPEVSAATTRSRLPTLPTIRMPRFGRRSQPIATSEHGAPEEIATPGELEAGQSTNIVR